MTLEERVKALEDLFEGVTRNISDDGLIPFIKFPGRVGIMTDYWSKKPYGEGAALSIGTAIDRFALYAEIDDIVCRTHPSTAIYGAVVGPNPFQKNIAFEAHAENAPKGNIAYYGDVQYSPEAKIKITPIQVAEVRDGSVNNTGIISADGIVKVDGEV